MALLEQIMAWVVAHDSRHVFWLNGLAGTGKSTIARTIARMCADQKRLGASFFFSLGGGALATARYFVTTVAVQLAKKVPALRPHIFRAVRAEPYVAGLTLQDQWARLVLEPLAKVGGVDISSSVSSSVSSSSSSVSGRLKSRLLLGRPVVIVIDALDECDDEDETGAVLGLLALGAVGKRSWLRVLLTSRPETPIRYGIKQIPAASLACLILHRLDPAVVDGDIATYLADNLRLAGATSRLGPDWPGAEALQQLVMRAGGLFIWAATAYRFICTEGGLLAKDRLDEVLSGVFDELVPETSLDRIYRMVLTKAVSGSHRERERQELCDALHNLLATLAVLAAPLDRESLSHLAATSSALVDRALHNLHSIVDVPDGEHDPLRLHHASFRDFIVDTSRCTDMRFAVDENFQHKTLADRCLHLMSEHLRKDICGLKAPGVLLSDVDRREIDRCLTPSLQYACCHWTHHVLRAPEHFVDYNSIVDFLHVHLLHWLEVLSLLERLPEAVHALRSLELLTVSVCDMIWLFQADF